MKQDTAISRKLFSKMCELEKKSIFSKTQWSEQDAFDLLDVHGIVPDDIEYITSFDQVSIPLSAIELVAFDARTPNTVTEKLSKILEQAKAQEAHNIKKGKQS